MWLPARQFAVAVYLLTCLVAVLALAVVLQRRAEPLLGAWPHRAALLVVLVLLPSTSEIQGNLANLHVWIAVSMAVVLVLPPAGTVAGRWLEAGYLAVGSLTGLVGVILLPVAAWNVLRWRSPAARARAAVVACGAVVNLAVAATAGRDVADGAGLERLVRLPLVLVKRVGGGLLYGERTTAEVWPTGWWSWWAVPAATVLLLALGLLLAGRRGPGWAWASAALLWIGLGALSVSGEGTDVDWSADHPYAHTRYFVLAIACLVLLVASTLPRATGRRRAACLVFALALVGFAGDAHIDGRTPSITPDAAARWQECVDTGTTPCRLEIAPAGWSVRVPPADPGSDGSSSP